MGGGCVFVLGLGYCCCFAAYTLVFIVMPLRGGEVLFLSGKSTQKRLEF
jgi:hypothetical protein